MDALSVDETRREALKKFVGWCKDYITGDEKGEAQFFLDRLFQAFGQKGVREVGGTSEFRIRKPKEDGGGVAFADLVWKPIVLVEMKRRGEKLIRHYRQAFDYWARLVPDRPRYVVLCNFDEFWVYDFTKQMDTPVDCVSLAELPDRYGPLAFLFPTGEKPTFGNDVEAITRPVAEKLAECFNKLIVRKVDRSLAQRFVLQILVAFFSEDIGLLKKYFVAQLLDDCKSPTDSYDLLGGLFTEMNTPSVTAGGRFKGVDYFNGGLFAEPARLELYDDELNQLRTCAKCDWSKISPEIFGAIFQHSMDAKERRAFGAHFTTPEDIMKIVKPTIVAPWLELIENADTIRRLSQLRQRLEAFHVLDPACGSGNFLYIAYREMKRLEARIFERMNELSKRGYSQQKMIGFVTASQFHGIDINPFAIELAKVTMMIARKLAIDELHMNERALPLDNLDKNFIADDALVDSSGNPTRWPRADVIIGNPPFTGAKLLKPTRGADYVKMLRKAFPDVPGMADYCVYWIRQTHDRLPACTADDPVAGRAGLVGTQNIRNNKSREGGLDYVVRSGTVVEAVDNQPWSGEANVHVSIANWVKHDPIAPRLTGRERRNVEAQLLVPNKRKLWFNAESSRSHSKPRKRGSGPASKHKHYEPDYRECEHINSALSDQIDVSGALRLRCNYEPQVCFNGQFPRCKEFEITASQAKQMRKADSKNCEVVFPCLIGTDFLGGGCSNPSFA